MLGETIRRRREERNLSQERLAELVGVSRQAISKWETGQALPTGDNLERLARALELEPEALTALLHPADAGGEPRRRPWRPAAALAGVVLAFLLGRLLAPGPALPPAESPPPIPSGSVGESPLLWPQAIPVVKRVQLDFDLVPPGEPMTVQFQRIGVLDQAEMLWEGPMGEEGALLAVAGTPVEDTGEYSLWVLGRGPADGDYLVLARVADLGPEAARTFTTEPFFNVLGYDGIAVCPNGGSTALFGLVEGQPRALFGLMDGFDAADLDGDGEQELICTDYSVGSGYLLYDREPDGFWRCEPEAPADGWPGDGMLFYRAEERAFTFLLPGDQTVREDAPRYDLLSDGFLLRREGDRSRRGGWQPGDPVFIFLAEEGGTPGPDDVTGWRSDGSPRPTARELARLAVRELESLTGWRPERCYVRSDDFGVSLSLTTEPGGRAFFSMQFDAAVTGRERAIQVIELTWQGEWTPWSPLTAEALPLPGEWIGWSDRERALWWCARRTDAGAAPVLSAEQYPDWTRCALADGRFYELDLDQGTGLLKAMRGPYPAGFRH